MTSIEEIKRLKKRFADSDGLYQGVRKEQKTDKEYIDDTFPVSEVREPHKIWRSGIGSRMVNAPAEQIVTSNPQSFLEVGNKDIGHRLNSEVNDWISLLRRQNPNPFKEFVKNLLQRGESYIRVVHNENWVTNPVRKQNGLPIFNRRGLPVLFLIPDPMVIYGSLEEDENGIPRWVIVFYPRQPDELIIKYPNWTNPKNRKEKDQAEWFEYYDAESIYYEADGEIVSQKENIYKFTPFVRKYSGFGRRSPEGKLEDLIVSDIKMSRDLIKQECITRSNIASIEHIFAHRPKTLIMPRGTISEADLKEMQWGSYDLNALEFDPNLGRPEFTDTTYPSVPPEMYANLASIRNEIAQRNPFVMAGFLAGTSGRHEDIRAMAAMRRYDTVIENTENAWATALEMALKVCQVVPTLKPDGLKSNDLNAFYKCEVKLKAEDPTEQDRLATLGSRLFQQGEIDLRTNLIEYQGKTIEEAEEIITNILVDKITLFNPDVAAVMGMVFAEEAGMSQYLEMVRQQRQGLETQPGATEMTRRRGEVGTEIGREMAPEGMRGARQPPERYTRGGSL